MRFSPPDMAVTIRGRRDPRGGQGQLLTVEDWGVGMDEAELAAANALLADPPEIDLSVSRRLGFHVVARLADRHGIRVVLSPTPGSGITASVTLPGSLFEVGPEPVGALPAVPATPPGRAARAPRRAHGHSGSPRPSRPTPTSRTAAPTTAVRPVRPVGPHRGGPRRPPHRRHRAHPRHRRRRGPSRRDRSSGPTPEQSGTDRTGTRRPPRRTRRDGTGPAPGTGRPDTDAPDGDVGDTAGSIADAPRVEPGGRHVAPLVPRSPGCRCPRRRSDGPRRRNPRRAGGSGPLDGPVSGPTRNVPAPAAARRVPDRSLPRVEPVREARTDTPVRRRGGGRRAGRG